MLKYLLIILITACQKDTIHPIKGEVVEAVYGLGIIKSENYYDARAAILSSVTNFYVSEGQEVTKDQKLFKIDQGTTFYAPFSGKITDIPVPIGENLFPGTTILSLVDLNNLYLEVSLEQQGAMKLSKNMKAEISFEFFRENKIMGFIETIYPKRDQFIAKVMIKEWPSGILPGMSADVAFEVSRKKDVTLVPVKAIANGYILVVRKNKKEKTKVKVGLVDQEMAEIIYPELSLDDEVVVP